MQWFDKGITFVEADHCLKPHYVSMYKANSFNWVF